MAGMRTYSLPEAILAAGELWLKVGDGHKCHSPGPQSQKVTFFTGCQNHDFCVVLAAQGH